MTRDDQDYYARRAQQEDEAASSAACVAARERHQELANAYRLRSTLIRAGLTEDGRSARIFTYEAQKRQPIVSSSTAALVPSPAMAPIPFCRA